MIILFASHVKGLRFKTRLKETFGGFPHISVGKESACYVGDLGSIPGLGRFPWRRKWQPTPLFLSGESHGQRSLAGYSPWGHKRGRHYWSSLAHMHSSIGTIRDHWGTHLRQSVVLIEPHSERQRLHRQLSPANHSGFHDMSDPRSGLYEGTLH